MPNAPFMYTCEEGQSFYFLGTLMTLNAGSAETGSHFSLIEQVSPPGFASALHMHHVKDEAFYILEGTFFLRRSNDQRNGRIVRVSSQRCATRLWR